MQTLTIFVLFAIGFVNCLEWPPYIKKCKYSELKTCGVANGNDALPTLLKGDPTYEFPYALPLALGDVNIDEPNLKISLKNSQLYGLDTMHIYQTFLEASTTRIGLTIDTLSLVGEYSPGSKVFGVILHEGGVANFTFVHGEYALHYPVVYKQKENNKPDAFPYRFFWDIEPKTSFYTFSGKDGTLYLTIENSKNIYEAVLPSFKSALTTLYQKLLLQLLKLFPLEVFFLPES